MAFGSNVAWRTAGCATPRRPPAEKSGWPAHPPTARGSSRSAILASRQSSPGETTGVGGPGVRTLEFSNLAAVYAAIARTYQLGVSLPDAPLQVFRKQSAGLPRSTEAERLVVQRIGQDVFRQSLLAYWNYRCPMTGVSDPSLLRASHIVPWAECDDDAQRLDVHNGLLLSALWDAAFDAGKISFADDGEVLFHPSLGATERALLLANAARRLVALSPKHLINMERHRKRSGFERKLS